MLTPDQIAIIKATVPLLETGGEALTSHFYATLLAENPGLRGIFNMQNQRSGAQARALANGVLIYAKNVDRLEALGPLVSQIVNKHVSLQVQPEHYPVVGAYLLRSIREVLGDEVATPAVLAAWGAAYGRLADILIGAEAEAYAAIESYPGGWRGARDFRVADIREESSEIRSFYLVPVDGRRIVAHVPGQYLALDLELDAAGSTTRRNYSISGAPDGRGYRISVKREPRGCASGHLHDRITVGSVLKVYAPAGDMKLADGARPLLLISGGVGITPMMAMLAANRHTTREVQFIHAARDKAAHAFRAEVAAIARPGVNVLYCYDSVEELAPEHRADTVQGRIGAQTLAERLPADRDVDAYVVGPKPFMASVIEHLRQLGVPAAQIHHEFFGPAQSLA
jgi:nitric oxide dioxygenase